MKKKDVIRFFDQRCRNLERCAHNLLEDFAVEDIHQFRVELKKLRALLRLLNAGREEGRAVYIGKSLHSFYATVGMLRGLQLQRQTIFRFCKKLQCPVPALYLAQLLQKESGLKAMIRSEALAFPLSAVRRRLRKGVQENLNNETADNFIAIKRSELLTLLAIPICHDEQLHQLRKHLKDLLYVWSLIGPSLADAFPGKILTEKKCLSLTEKLGDFQDMCIALDYLDVADLNVPLDETAALKAICFYCENRKIRLKEEITELLSGLREDLKKKDPVFRVYEII